MQVVVGALLYYNRVVNNKLLVILIAIVAQQAESTKQTAAAIDQLLDHVATHPKNGITYQASDMVLAAYSNTGLTTVPRLEAAQGPIYFYLKTRQHPSGTVPSS